MSYALIAHRGASHEAPENTLSAIKRALELPVQAIEIDVHLSKDLIPVVIHDETLLRTTGSPLKVADLTLKELKELDAGRWFSPHFKGEKIPTLEEILALPFHGKQLMVELKEIEGPKSAFVHIVHELTKHHSHIFLGSFSPEILKEALKKSHPLIGIAEDWQNYNAFREMGIQHFALDQALITNPFKDSGLFWSFTVDCHLEAKRLHSLGVHGIISNNPLSFLSL